MRKYVPAQTPSELWGRKSATESFIGIRLKDQNGEPVIGSRIRVKLPDGSTREGKTNADGELEITGFIQDGNALISLLDHCKPGKSEAPEWPEEKEFKATVVDELGNPVPGVWLYFRHGTASNLVRTDASGVARYKTTGADSVSVSFESADALGQVMRGVWSKARVSVRDDWVKRAHRRLPTLGIAFDAELRRRRLAPAEAAQRRIHYGLRAQRTPVLS